MSDKRKSRQLPAYGGRYKRGNRMGYGGIVIKIWEASSHSSFVLGLAELCDVFNLRAGDGCMNVWRCSSCGRNIPNSLTRWIYHKVNDGLIKMFVIPLPGAICYAVNGVYW